MYRLMKSRRMVVDHMLYGPMVSYRHQELERFQAFPAAIIACDIASELTGVRYCILDEAGQEYFAGTWIS